VSARAFGAATMKQSKAVTHKSLRLIYISRFERARPKTHVAEN